MELNTYIKCPQCLRSISSVFYTLLSQHWQQLVTLLSLLHPKYMVSLRPGTQEKNTES